MIEKQKPQQTHQALYCSLYACYMTIQPLNVKAYQYNKYPV